MMILLVFTYRYAIYPRTNKQHIVLHCFILDEFLFEEFEVLHDEFEEFAVLYEKFNL